MYADNAAYFSLALVLTAFFGLLTYLAYRSRGVPALLKGAGVTLVPLALWLTFTLRLVANVVDEVGSWATALVFSPRVWIGLVVAVVAVVLFAAGTALGRRGEPAKGPRKQKAAAAASTSKGVSSRKGSGDPEMDDIEALLRKHGIS